MSELEIAIAIGTEPTKPIKRETEREKEETLQEKSLNKLANHQIMKQQQRQLQQSSNFNGHG